MIKKTVLEELDSKIILILEKYESLKEENKRLQATISSSRETEAKLRQELLKLKEEDELKELELEDIVVRIEKGLEKELSFQKMSILS